MNRMILKMWNNRSQVVEYDVDNGKVKGKGPATKNVRVAGWAYRRGRKWYSLWNDNGHLVFQSEHRKWPLGEEFEFANTTKDDGKHRRFQISSQGKPVFEIEYKGASSFLISLLDPAYDCLDEELEDFLLFLGRQASDQRWRENMIRQWTRFD